MRLKPMVSLDPSSDLNLGPKLKLHVAEPVRFHGLHNALPVILTLLVQLTKTSSSIA